MLQQLDLFGDAPTNRPEASLAKQKGKYKITPPKIIVSDEHKKIQDAPEKNTNIHAVETKSKTQVKQKPKHNYNNIVIFYFFQIGGVFVSY